MIIHDRVSQVESLEVGDTCANNIGHGDGWLEAATELFEQVLVMDEEDLFLLVSQVVSACCLLSHVIVIGLFTHFDQLTDIFEEPAGLLSACVEHG